MKNKTHPHHKLIDEWCMNMETELEEYNETDKGDARIGEVLYDVAGNRQFRIKQREFVKGEWYPCVSDVGCGIYMWDGSLFTLLGSSIQYIESIDNMTYIGESLGEVEFPIISSVVM